MLRLLAASAQGSIVMGGAVTIRFQSQQLPPPDSPIGIVAGVGSRGVEQATQT